MTIGKTIALTRWTFVGKVMSACLNQTRIAPASPRSNRSTLFSAILAGVLSIAPIFLLAFAVKSCSSYRLENRTATADRNESPSRSGPPVRTSTVWDRAAKLHYGTTPLEIEDGYRYAKTSKFYISSDRYAAAYVTLKKKGYSAANAKQTMWDMLNYDDTSRVIRGY